MKRERSVKRITGGEALLLALTAAFLCLVTALYLRDRKALEAPIAVETEISVPQEEIQPDLTPLDLNTATAEDLTALPGIGEALAQRIVDYREAHGPFEAVEDIMNVSGIGEGKLAGMEGLIAVDGKETE